MRFVGYTPVYSSAVAALVSVPTNESKTGEGLVKMRSLWGENTDDSETGSGLNSFEKETWGDWSYCTDKQRSLTVCKRWEAWQDKVRLAPAAAGFHPHSHARLQHTWKMCYFMQSTFSIKLSITWLRRNVCARMWICTPHEGAACGKQNSTELRVMSHVKAFEFCGALRWRYESPGIRRRKSQTDPIAIRWVTGKQHR